MVFPPASILLLAWFSGAILTAPAPTRYLYRVQRFVILHKVLRQHKYAGVLLRKGRVGEFA